MDQSDLRNNEDNKTQISLAIVSDAEQFPQLPEVLKFEDDYPKRDRDDTFDTEIIKHKRIKVDQSVQTGHVELPVCFEHEHLLAAPHTDKMIHNLQQQRLGTLNHSVELTDTDGCGVGLPIAASPGECTYPKKFECPTCGKLFAGKNTLRRHQLRHMAPQPIRCVACPKLYSRRDHMLKHLQSHKKDHFYVCTLCEYRTELRSEYLDHFRIDHPEAFNLEPNNRKGVARIATFIASADSLSTLDLDIGDTTYPSKIRPIQSCAVGVPVSHLESHKEDAQSDEVTQALVVASASLSACDTLSTPSLSTPSLSAPFSSTFSFTIPSCGSSLIACHPSSLELKALPPGSEPLPQFKIYGNPSSDRADEKSFNQPHPNYCMHCCRSFAQIGSLRRHLRIHSGHRPFQCSTCNKSFYRHDHLSKHAKTHENTDRKNRNRKDVQTAALPYITKKGSED